jgi:hypothetical protein
LALHQKCLNIIIQPRERHLNLAVSFRARLIVDNDLASRERRLKQMLIYSIVAHATRVCFASFYRALKHTAKFKCAAHAA